VSSTNQVRSLDAYRANRAFQISILFWSTLASVTTKISAVDEVFGRHRWQPLMRQFSSSLSSLGLTGIRRMNWKGKRFFSNSPLCCVNFNSIEQDFASPLMAF
jgi:hypothetical protein